MDILIKGNTKLSGEVEISSAKNSILPILAASILSSEPVTIHKVPLIKDVFIIAEILETLGLQLEWKQQDITISGLAFSTHPPFDLVRQIRASFLLMGPLLAKYGKARIAFPGGCAIGHRPIDLHLKGLQRLGASIHLTAGDVMATAQRLYGAHIYLDYPSVGATENLIMAASIAEGTSYIENAAREPEIVDLANFINAMGGKISGAGTGLITIEGVKKLSGVEYQAIPDRIEAGTYMVAVAATSGNALIKNVIPEHVKAVSAKLMETGAVIEEEKNQLWVQGSQEVQPVYIKTLPYPGFPTDMQAQMMAYLSRGKGSSIISESVFENRFMHVPELKRMGAKIRIEGRTSVIEGKSRLTGTTVKASDLRAGAALVIAGMMADGITMVKDHQHVERGYENLAQKLNLMGAEIHYRDSPGQAL
ncbi:MAG TPA: UDP-N-acetylglucosamine 1-carboxyvinyltransferase [Syntrophomonadaceae bacterium]|nr:UDP-N-acetylglucosamine 1-carboxyvinyltransferase [Syntrophomonadaceae bacterium]